MTSRFLAPLAAGLIFVAAIAALAEPHGPEQPVPVRQFKTAIKEYTALHRRIEQQLPAFGVTEHAVDIYESSNALAAAIQTSRSHAREGEIFSADVAAYFRLRISGTLTAHGFLPEEVISATLEEADAGAAQPVVNGRFPWGRAAAMWPCVLEALPQLPVELQYRFVGPDLVLVDTHADLVVDILRRALR